MTKPVTIGNIKIGSKYPIRIKGMLKKSLSNKDALLKEALDLKKEGADIIRVAIKNRDDSNILSYLKKNLDIPFVADIHFNYKLALEAIDAGFDGIRLNPLNIKDINGIREVIKKAKTKKTHIRVGINSGGFKKRLSKEKLANEMVKNALEFIKLLEKEEFQNISVSLKASDVSTTILANRILSKKTDYPIHLGVTATGTFLEGIVKSVLGIGILLNEGIGNILRVSLTSDSVLEIKIAKFILQALNLRYFSPEIISCPTCSRTQVDLIKIVNEFQNRLDFLSSSNLPKKIAIMGCEVNGPGEASVADIGIAFGNKRAILFKKGKIVRVLKEDNLIEEFLKEVCNGDHSRD